MKKLALLVLCLLCLTSCSVKLAYNFLDFAMSWQLKRFVSLDAEQKDLASTKIKEFHAWHRQTQLTQYAAYIETVLQHIESHTIDGKWVHKETDKVQEMLDVSVEHLKPAIVSLAASFSDKQVNEVLEKLAEKRKKYREKYVEVSREKRRKLRRDGLMDNIGPFFGRLTENQQLAIDAWLDNLTDYEHLTLKQQKVWADRLQDALKERNQPEVLQAKLDKLMFYRTDDWDPELEAILDHNQKITYELLAKLYNSQTPKQRERNLAKLNDYREDFLQLAANRK